MAGGVVVSWMKYRLWGGMWLVVVGGEGWGCYTHPVTGMMVDDVVQRIFVGGNKVAAEPRLLAYSRA